MKIDVPYGAGARAVLLPSGVRVDHLGPRGVTALEDPAAALDRACATPEDSLPLADRVRGKSALVVVSDLTRGGGTRTLLPLLLERLRTWGAIADRTRILIARGTHRQMTREERGAFRELVADTPFDEHDCDVAENLSALLLTTRGTPVRIHRAIREADVVILLSSISFHYFAGYGGGRKLILPGCADRGAILANHRLSLVDGDPVQLHPECRPGNLDGNPVHEDMMEALAAFDHLFAVQSFCDSNGELIFVNAGNPVTSHREACAVFDGMFRRQLDAPYPVIVLSAGGAPYDVNLLQAHKALYHGARAGSEGATILYFAECAEGMGSKSLETALGLPREDYLRSAHARYDLNNQTAVSFIGLTSRFHVGIVTELDDDAVVRAGAHPVDNAEAFLAAAAERAGSDRVAVIRHGSQILPTLAGSSL